jgi:DEAD/DEAH box helicase domain-containing protein
MKILTFDIETTNTFDEVGSPNAEDLDLAVICVHDSDTDQITHYFKEDLNKLWPIIEASDMLVTFNGDHFDIPLLNKYYAGDLTQIKSLDLLVEIKKSLGRRIKLDDIASATLGESKSADGLQSIIWWRQGKIDEVVSYCKQDVAVTRKVYDFAMQNSHLLYIKDGKKEQIPLNTSEWEKPAENNLAPTLGF